MNRTDPLTPTTTAALLDILTRFPGRTRLMAGGTDLTPRLGRVLTPETRLVDLSGLDELRGIVPNAAEIRVGAMETMARLAADDLLNREAVALAQAAGRVGSWQIRTRATVGGNSANASPAADTPPALAALAATVHLVSPRGQRSLAVEDFITGPNQSALADDEALVEFRLPRRPGQISAFAKVGSRTEMSIARLNLAVAALPSKGKKISEARVFLGTLGRAARRAQAAERVLLEHGLSREEDFNRALMDAVAEAIPGRSTLAYKQSAIQALGQDVLAELRRQARPKRSGT